MSDTKKKSRRRVSLFFNYVAFFIAVEIVSLLAFGGVLFYFISNSWEDEQKQKLYDCAENIAYVYESYLSRGETENEVSFSGLCHAVAGVSDATKAEILIADTQGRIIVCSDMANTDDEQTGEITCPVHSGIRIPGEIYTGILADGMLATRSDLGGSYDEEFFVSATVVKDYADGTPHGIVFSVQSLDMGLKPYKMQFTRIYILAASAFIIITSLIIYVSTYNITRPLRDMSEATKQYSKGDFSYRIKRNRRNTVREFDELSAAINSMADSLEEFENSRTEFVANVSHELKTPMTTIGGFIDGILDGTIDSSQQNYYLEIVSDEVKRLSRLVVAMLNMSKIEAGEMRIKPERFNVTQQLIGIFMSFEQKIEDKKIDVKGLESLSNFYIEADIDMISQVFYNLIDNAVKFTDENGEISAFMNDDGEYVSVTVRNTGKGIKPEDLDHIFERFYKGDKSRSLNAKSAGLGLFIVKNVINLHGGEITADSVYEKYTEFTVKLKIRLIG